MIFKSLLPFYTLTVRDMETFEEKNFVKHYINLLLSK